MSDNQSDTSKFQIFRASDAKELMEEGCMTVEPFTPTQREGMDKLVAAGFMDGDEVKVLVNIPGFSLTHVWFKKDYPLPLHSHDADCLYYIIAGSIKLGTEILGERDSFFIPSGVPYSYRPGPRGAEILEFRHATHFSFINMAKGEAFWEKAAEIAALNSSEWKTATRPKLNA